MNAQLERKKLSSTNVDWAIQEIKILSPDHKWDASSLQSLRDTLEQLILRQFEDGRTRGYDSCLKDLSY